MDKTTHYVKDFRTLNVYQKSLEVSKEIYVIIKGFPDFEKYTTTSQILRSCNSISANIAEGNGQLYPKKEINFYNNALGSANETRHWLLIAYQNGYITNSVYDLLEAKLVEIVKMLFGCIRKLQS